MLCRRVLGKRAVAALTATASAALTFTASSGEAAAADRLLSPQRPTSLPAEHGDVLSSEPGVFYLDPLKAIKVNASVHRIMYRTTDRAGKAIVVTGTVLNPRTSQYGQRPIVAFAPGTQGLADKCAPSRQLADGTEYEALPIKKLLDQGYAVVVTDYQGLGTPGIHTYMDREAQGRAVLDSVRAAQRLNAVDLPDAGPVALYGYSQGGGATASAAELAPTYVPELKIKGAVVGAPPADMNKVADSMDGSAYGAFFNYALSGLSTAYGIDIDPYLNALGKRVTNDLRDNLCTTQALAKYPFLNSRFLTVDGRPLTERLKRAPWDTIVAEQQLGKRKPAVPVLLSHSALDDVVPQQVGKNLAADWCRRGTTVRFAGNYIPGHIAATEGTSAEGLPWLADRFAGRAASSTC
ncbi:lipase family protein (plasmid) [Streptomyces sp. NBC_01591]|uniref:alpha/beta fold hydrolase n=1 Tax=Streptomyces sp. NBC_01591 TaxID=2975888 RepID=UPI002DD98E51|nr:alpha/beta fold hydrolase [Streptomyces sp. NBC_01591]WSD73991.1 lipase family protein [Streptomyces sp. NBC_01591]